MIQIGNKKILSAYIGNTKLTGIRLGEVSLLSGANTKVFSFDFPDIVGNIQLGLDDADAITDILAEMLLDLESSYADGFVDGVRKQVSINKIGTNLYEVPSFCSYLKLQAVPLYWAGEQGVVGSASAPFSTGWDALPALYYSSNISSTQVGKISIQIGVPKYTFYNINYNQNDWVTFGYYENYVDSNYYSWNSSSISSYVYYGGVTYCISNDDNLRPYVDAASYTYNSYNEVTSTGPNTSQTRHYLCYRVDSVVTGGGVHSIKIPVGWKLIGGWDSNKDYETSLFNSFGSEISEAIFDDTSTKFKVTARP